MPEPPKPPHAEPDFVVRNQRPVPLAGCIFLTTGLALLVFPLLCVLQVWVGLVYLVGMIVLAGLVWPRLVSRVRLWDRLTVLPGERHYFVNQLASLVVRPDPREDYAESGRLYELTFSVRGGETYRLMATADDAQRVMGWGRMRGVVVENQCDRGP